MRAVLVFFGAALASAAALPQSNSTLSADDRHEIEALAQRYGAALGSCDAQAFADLFESRAGFFASGFRGRVEGRARLVALVESERHCRAPSSSGTQPRPGARPVPAVALESSAAGVHGTIDLGGAGRYEDEYVRTPAGWRFASRTVVTPAESAAGLDARTMAAVRALSADLPLADHYETDEQGKRFIASGVVLRVENGTVNGRVHLADGSRYDDVYEQAAPGAWRIRSRTLVRAAAN